jgi:MoxR-like ATPase
MIYNEFQKLSLSLKPGYSNSALFMRNPELDAILADINRIILGKERAVRQALACLLAHGHLLIEDLPGVGKTTLAHVLARVLGLDFQRIQFTSDMLPADILGVSTFDRASGVFHFHPGPIFAQVILADEINRATPKAQSALLEAMEERQVTIEGQTRILPEPFFVIATQNPTSQVGTFPLPESQLDRFLFRIELGYPDPAAERELLAGADRRQMLAELAPRIQPTQLLAFQRQAQAVHASPALIDYVQALVRHTRAAPEWQAGLSPRAGLGLLAAARAWALLDGRDHVLPEDVQAVLPAVISHRLRPHDDAGKVGAGDTPNTAQNKAIRLIEAVPLP